MARYDMKDVVVLLPGITGSVLTQNGKVVWGYSASTVGKALLTQGASLQEALALPHDDPDVDDLGDGIVAEELMPDLHLLPGLWKIDGYTRIVERIRDGFEVTEGKNFFRFPYDWRRDNRVAARKLARQGRAWLAQWRESSGHADARLVLIAHSMGGLVCRYFLECLEGWKDTRALITFGTPFRGSLNALDSLANGLRKGPLDLSALGRQFTAIYQLLPTFKCYDAGNGELMRVGETSGIPNVDARMAAAALAFHNEIKAAVADNRKPDPDFSAGYRIYPIVGIAQDTSLSARLEGGRVKMLPTYKGDALGGDGTVPRVSAIPLEMSDDPNATYAATQHGSLQNADATLVQLVGVLSNTAIDLGVFRKPAVSVAIEVADLFFSNEPVTVRARPTDEAALVATFCTGQDRTPVAQVAMVPDGGEWYRAVFQPKAPGAFRVTVGGPDVEEAEDSFVVIDAAGATP